MERPLLPRKCKIPLNPVGGTVFTECEFTRKVLEIDHLRETILDYVIHDGKSVSIANVKNCRLVSKTWRSSTSRVFLKCREPLFQFRTKANKREPIKGTPLHQFVESVPKMLQMDERIPPHSIHSSVNRFHEQNHAFFLKCFRTCGSSLVRLELEATEGCHPKALRKNIVFPKLQMLRMNLDNGLNYRAQEMDDKINYIQSVFNSSEQLKSFVFSWNSRRVPDNFNNLIFPTTLTELELDCALSDTNLVALVKNPLSNLKKLELYLFDMPLKNEILKKILENARKTLQSFSIRELKRRDHTGVHGTTLQLPLMEKMEKLNVETQYPQFTNHCLERFVPQLNDLTLERQSISAFRKYTDTSCFLSVTSLMISLWSQIPNDFIHINFDLNAMQSLKTAFPNLQKLCIPIYDLDTTAFVFIIKEMQNLKHLHLVFEVSSYRRRQVAQVADSAFWDALFIGVPIESVAALKKSPSLWKNLEKESTVSIRNLTELHTLEIQFDMDYKLFEISSAAFRFAFFKMPNLSNLIFRGYNITVPEEMQIEWRKQGRSININNYTASSIRLPVLILRGLQ